LFHAPTMFVTADETFVVPTVGLCMLSCTKCAAGATKTGHAAGDRDEYKLDGISRWTHKSGDFQGNWARARQLHCAFSYI